MDHMTGTHIVMADIDDAQKITLYIIVNSTLNLT